MTAGFVDAASWLLLVTGGIFGIIGGIGVVRLPDFYSRLHASSVTDTLAAYLILGGLMLQGGLTLVTAKLALILFFLFFTSPVAAHALANTAYNDGLRPWTGPRAAIEKGWGPAGPPEPPEPEPEPKLLEEAPAELPTVREPAMPAVISPEFAETPELEPAAPQDSEPAPRSKPAEEPAVPKPEMEAKAINEKKKKTSPKKAARKKAPRKKPSGGGRKSKTPKGGPESDS